MPKKPDFGQFRGPARDLADCAILTLHKVATLNLSPWVPLTSPMYFFSIKVFSFPKKLGHICPRTNMPHAIETSYEFQLTKLPSNPSSLRLQTCMPLTKHIIRCAIWRRSLWHCLICLHHSGTFANLENVAFRIPHAVHHNSSSKHRSNFVQLV